MAVVDLHFPARKLASLPAAAIEEMRVAFDGKQEASRVRRRPANIASRDSSRVDGAITI
jgi:hypothetical protein